MKKFFLSVIAGFTAVVTNTYAQSSMLATLSHDGEIATYYGTTALREACNAADHGDVITLSSGSFLSANIEKALTIRGSGMNIDNSSQTEPTIITGDFTIQIADSISERLTIEGIYHNHTITYKGVLKNATFIKDRFFKITYYDSESKLPNATFVHCKIASYLHLHYNSSASCVNCVVSNPVTQSSTTSNFEFNNCVIYSNGTRTLYSSSLKSSIIITDYGFSASDVAYNCVGITLSNTSNIFNEIPNTTNVMKGYTDVFKTYTGTYNDNETFELTDEAKTTLLGIDGTQVGIYGGNMPFSTTPTNPQITKCNVAAKSTADGKLSVDITVNGAE